MNKEIFEGRWNQLKGKIKEKWGKFTDDEVLNIGGKWDQMIGTLEKKYGYTKDRAIEELKKWKEKF